MTKRSEAKAATRQLILDKAREHFRFAPFDSVTMRDLAQAIGMSTGALFGQFADKAALYQTAMGFPAPWRPIGDAPKGGQLLLLLVDVTPETNGDEVAAQSKSGYLWSGNGLEDARFVRTIGHNNFENDGDDRWQMAGWCWSHDHYTEGHGTPVAYIELDAVAPPFEAGLAEALA